MHVEQADQALTALPPVTVEVLEVEGTPLTFITSTYTTGAGEARTLDVLSWDGRFPVVELRVAFDDWCYPGGALTWEIGTDGSVAIPSNGGDPASDLHCGQTPAVTYVWDGENYVAEAGE